MPKQKENRMKKTMLKTSKFNTQTNWDRLKKFMLKFEGDIVLNGQHRIVWHGLSEEHGLLLNLDQTSSNADGKEQITICPGCINTGVIQGNLIMLSDHSGQESTLEFYELVEAPIE